MKKENIPAYEIVKQENLTDIHSVGYLLRHKKTGARLVLVENDDENKVFSIAFRTTPKNSTGVPHILEHSVLCGSREFPLKMCIRDRLYSKRKRKCRKRLCSNEQIYAR